MKKMLSAFAMVMIVFGSVMSASLALGADESENYPIFFKVRSEDGGESLTAWCNQIAPGPRSARISCKFDHVRINPPKPKVSDTDVVMLIENAVTAEVEKRRKANPSSETDPKQVLHDYRQGMEQIRQSFCQQSSDEFRVFIEEKVKTPETGPKRRATYQEMLAACEVSDPIIFFYRMQSAFEQRTCDLYVDHFALEFKNAGQGRWLYQQESPDVLAGIVKTYVIARDGPSWSLTETRVATKDPEEKPVQTTWRLMNPDNYELPCDFLQH